MGKRVNLDSHVSKVQPRRHINQTRNNRPLYQNQPNDNPDNQVQESQTNNQRSLEIDKKKQRIIVKQIIKIIIPILPIILPILFLLSIILFVVFEDDSSSSIGGVGYYNFKCDEITVIMTDKSDNYAPVGLPETYDITDYVAGVIAAEVGQLRTPEVYKAFSIAARSYALMNVDDSCTIESSDRKQVFRDITSKSTSIETEIYEAVEETDGQVLMKDGELYSGSYDAFCSIDKDSEYYTIKQQNQKIPISWVDSQHGIAEEWKQGTCAGNHGRGMSQWGAYYLATEQDYTYDELIDYYYGSDGVTIETSGLMQSIAGLDIKSTTNASVEMNRSLSSFLAENGSSIGEYNQFIYDSVNDVGAGSREGVVTAAVSLINYLYDNYNAKLPYYWGGNYQAYGVNPRTGEYQPSMTSRYGGNFYYISFDCSGFVSWAIKNGGYKMDRKTTTGFHNSFSSDSCDIEDSGCIGEPGDLINSYNSHVELIIGVDEDSDSYYVAQSTGNYGVVMNQRGMHVGNGNNTKILHMGNYYSNTSNVDPNYPQ